MYETERLNGIKNVKYYKRNAGYVIEMVENVVAVSDIDNKVTRRKNDYRI